ncbi:MOSC domain-containing protein [Actinoplanes flavus]|uniref:Transcription elongation factor n=1 Tax=Actinoplanes flavus TaxID=2820290 RepID=A0ABS3UHM4_9ACTN|nr:transcription elongation factor [Actinoplanes flavus]MBO3738269.1 transcription elongation factor [Actinoplanes flavus]
MSAESGSVAAVSRNDVYSFTKPNRDEIVLVAGIGVEGDVHAGVHVRHRSRVQADPTQPNLRQVHLIQAELFDEVASKGYDVPSGGLGENVTTHGLDLLGLPRGTILRFGAVPAAEPARRDGVGVPGAVFAGAEAATLDEATARDGVAVGEAARRDGVAVLGAVFAAAEAATLDEATARDGVAVGEAARRDGVAVLGAVFAAAEAATLDEATARAAVAVEEAARRDRGDDPRPAVILAGLRNPCAQINGFRAGLLKEVLRKDERGDLVRKAGVMGVVLRGGVIRPGDPVAVELPPGPHGPLERV